MLFPFVSPRFSSVFLQKPLAGVKSITASTALYWKTRLRRSCFARALTAAETLRSLKDGDVAAERINQVGVFEQEILELCGIIPGTSGNQSLKSSHMSMAPWPHGLGLPETSLEITCFSPVS